MAAVLEFECLHCGESYTVKDISKDVKNPEELFCLYCGEIGPVEEATSDDDEDIDLDDDDDDDLGDDEY